MKSYYDILKWKTCVQRLAFLVLAWIRIWNCNNIGSRKRNIKWEWRETRNKKYLSANPLYETADGFREIQKYEMKSKNDTQAIYDANFVLSFRLTNANEWKLSSWMEFLEFQFVQLICELVQRNYSVSRSCSVSNLEWIYLKVHEVRSMKIRKVRNWRII